MKRTDASGHIANKYTDGNATLGVPATMLNASSMNAIQEEIARAIELAGLTLDPLINEQLWAAIQVGGKDSFAKKFLQVQDEKTTNTAGGTFTSGADQTRALGAVKTNSITGASVLSNQIILPGGTYFTITQAPAYGVNEHQAKLYNVTDSAAVLIGTSEFSPSAGALPTWSKVSGVFILGGTKTLELRHRCNLTNASTGLGRAANLGNTEIYSTAQIWKLV